jgi:hypothetical protein
MKFNRKIALLVLAALIAYVCFCLPQYFREIRSTKWSSTSGVITESRLQVGYIKQIEGFWPDLRYDYSVNGIAFTGDRIDFHLQDHLQAKDGAESWLKFYPTGKVVTVFYDSNNPSISILEPGMKREQRFLFYLAFGFLAVFVISFLFVLFVRVEPG